MITILIVDDEQLIRQGLRARIEYLGIDVAVSYTHLTLPTILRV